MSAWSVSPAGEKSVRAGRFAAQAEGGTVYLVRAPWNGAYLDELTAFPTAGLPDDQVGASSGALTKLAKPKRRLNVWC
jgi:predicted phage terminase large subunit-like protein